VYDKLIFEGDFMLTTTIFPGRYIQGYEAINRLGPEIARLGNTGYLICSPTVYGKLLPTFKAAVEKHVKVFAEQFIGECCEENISLLKTTAATASADVIIGMGGGKTLDTAKAVAYYLKKPLIIVPTVASSDAPCSAVTVLYTQTGEPAGAINLLHNPDVVLVDSKIIAQAPVRFLVAGMGDSLAHRFEAEACKATSSPNMTFTGDVGSLTGYTMARMCYDTLLEYGLMAKKACEVHAATPALEHVIEANTLLSGLGFENSGLAGCHGLQIGFSFLKETHPKLHGELVAFSTQVILFLTDRNKELINEVYTFCESIGLPTTLADINLADVSDIDLMKVAEIVCNDGAFIHNEAIKATKESVFAAIKAADYEGRIRKGN
jgi:glycerol dehydrogenase